MNFHRKTTDAAKGKWKGILLELGVPASALSGRHGPCPMCGGTDRFRFDNKGGDGTYYCNQCGPGGGMQLAMNYLGEDFAKVAARVDAIIGNLKPDAPSRPAISDEERRDMLRSVYRSSQPIEVGDLAHVYLTARGVGELIYPKALRFARALKDGSGGVRPALVAMVGVYGEDRFCSIHRTFLRPDGKAKAEMDAPRKLMPGPLPDGACVMLSEYEGGPLGIAEGIETAMSASAIYEMPVWAAINSTIMAKWVPPPQCQEVAVFADHDAKFGGQAAAYTLAHRLAVQGLTVSVHVPPVPGDDFNDVWLAGRGRREAFG